MRQFQMYLLIFLFAMSVPLPYSFWEQSKSWGQAGQNQFSTDSPARDELKGLKDVEVVDRLGEPDHRRVEASGSETWVYGKSIVLFTQGRVAAWSNAGDLKQRQSLGALKRQEKSTTSLSIWKNPWTPERRVNPEDAIDTELLGKKP